MAWTAGRILLLLGVLSLAGCGTLGNLSGRDKVYGGTQLDGGAVVEACTEVAHHGESPALTYPQASVMFVYSCLDLPLSIMGDTLTLPVTVPVSCYRWWKASYGSEQFIADTHAVTTATASAAPPVRHPAEKPPSETVPVSSGAPDAKEPGQRREAPEPPPAE